MHEIVSGPDFAKLTKWINRYDGFFTSKHARLAGYSVQNQAYYVKAGHWERYGWGIFRYKYYPHPAGERPDLVVATLWSCDRFGVPKGVVSHDTALSVHRLSTWAGHGVHMTVPKNFRRRSQCQFRVRLHHASLDDDDIEDMGAFKVTTPLRTITDLLLSPHIESIHIADAMTDALRKKLITFNEIKEAQLEPLVKQSLIGILLRIDYPQGPMKYNDPQEFLAALDEQLRKRAQQIGRHQDYQKLKEELAIERFLARIDPEIAVVKGGAAAMLTVSNAPHTSDVDLVITDSVMQSLGLNAMKPEHRTDTLAEFIQDQLRTGRKEDFFRFKFEDAFPILDLKPGHACARINITVMVGKSEMHFLQVDIALQDGDLPTVLVNGRDMLGFAGIANPQVRTVTPEFLFADKVTLYLEEHGRPDADRVKDIVHAALVAENCKLNLDELTKILANRAIHRNVVDKLSKGIPNPPDRWNDRFQELIEQAQSQMTMHEAMKLIRASVDEVVNKATQLARENTTGHPGQSSR